MSRKVADCRSVPSTVGCTLTLVGEESEVVKAAVEHAVSVHGHEDSSMLREQIRGMLKDEVPSVASTAESRSFDHPDEVRAFKAHGQLKILNFKDGRTIGKGMFEPGWVWSKDVKPIAGTTSCQAPHSGYCLAGEMEIRMDDGRTFRVRAGDAFEIEPGHDAHVVGSQTCELVDVGGFAEYAKPVVTKPVISKNVA